MNIKRYLAPDMRRAINRVREEHGPDAVILSSESVEGGVEIIAADDYDLSLVARAFGQPGRTAGDGAAAPEKAAATEESANLATAPASPMPEAIPEPVRSAESASRKAAKASTLARAAKLDKSAEPTASIDIETTRELRAIQKDLFALKGLVRERFAWSDLRSTSPQRHWLMRRAEAFGLTAELADTVVSEVEHPELDDRAWRELVFGLARRLRVMREDPIDQGGVFALVGPTGVGKTTTIAKLAARHCLRHGRESLALNTTDCLRIGAQRQFEAFGAILGVPVRTADSPEGLTRLLGELAQRRLVLIDTAGSAPRDSAISNALKPLEAGAELKRFLVLAANMQAGVMRDAVRAFGGRELAGVVLTKLDETNALGTAISALIDSKLPAVWLSDGQRVPEDLKLARVAQLLKHATAVSDSGPDKVVPAFAGELAIAADRGGFHAGL
jgi:flagellar biosynthesis protein FlhF